MAKHPALVCKEATGLLVVDVQDKFRPAIERFEDVVMNSVRLILGCQMFEMPIVVCEQYPQGLGTTDVRIRRQFQMLEVVEKTEFACTDNHNFWVHVNPLKLKSVIVTGIETHVCVYQTVLGLLQKGLKVFVIADAVASRFERDSEVALAAMERAGANIVTTEMALFALCEKSGTESFKNIQKMVRARKAGHDASAPIHGEVVADAVVPVGETIGAPDGATLSASAPVSVQIETPSLPVENIEMLIPPKTETFSVNIPLEEFASAAAVEDTVSTMEESAMSTSSETVSTVSADSIEETVAHFGSSELAVDHTGHSTPEHSAEDDRKQAEAEVALMLSSDELPAQGAQTESDSEGEFDLEALDALLKNDEADQATPTV